MTITGGDGSSLENAVILPFKKQGTAVYKEYDFIDKACGERNVDYFFRQQTFKRIGEKYYDIIEITMKDTVIKEFWFDISASFQE